MRPVIHADSTYPCPFGYMNTVWLLNLNLMVCIWKCVYKSQDIFRVETYLLLGLLCFDLQRICQCQDSGLSTRCVACIYIRINRNAAVQASNYVNLRTRAYNDLIDKYWTVAFLNRCIPRSGVKRVRAS